MHVVYQIMHIFCSIFTLLTPVCFSCMFYHALTIKEAPAQPLPESLPEPLPEPPDSPQHTLHRLGSIIK